MKKLFTLSLTFALLYAAQLPLLAQEQKPTEKPSAEDLEKQKEEREKNAYRLLDQVLDEAQSLRLTENHVRVQLNAADMLWTRNQGRARSLFTMAAEGIAELGRNPQTTTNRRGNEGNPDRRAMQLRQELVMSAARHDAQLAYQLLATTKPPTPIAQPTVVDARNPRPQLNQEENLEQMLLGRIAALDPKLAAQNAEQMMEKGQFPRSLGEVINQLSKQDPEAGAKLADKTVKKIQAANILTNSDAAGLAQQMLTAGVRPPASDSTTASNSSAAYYPGGRPAVLEQSAYVDLLSAAIDAALRASAPAQTNQRAAGPGTPQRGRIQAGPGPGPIAATRPAPGTPPTEAQIEQGNARRLLAALMIAMPVIEQHLPAKAPGVRQKLTEMGVGNLASMGQPAFFPNANPTSDNLIQAATNAPSPMQDRLFQQAALKALEEGNVDRARQIAADHLPEKSRNYVLERIENRELAKKAETARFEEIRQRLSRLQTDNEKIDLLLQMAGDVQKANSKLAIQLLEEAKQMTSRRATSYDHFNQQLRVARAFSSIDPARSFEVLDPGINQLNELLAAAVVLNGFEINMFRDGEMTMQGGSALASTITRFGQELAILARTDLERSEVLAGRFQMTEPRIMTRIQIVQGLLNPRAQQGPVSFNRTFGENVNVVRPE